MLIGLFSPAFPQGIVIDHTCTDLSRIPDSWISQAQSDLHIAYQHTSHGSQLITGMNALESFPSFGTKYEWSDNGSSGLWAVRGITRVYFGSSDDGAVPANYEGRGISDIGIFRSTSGLWAIRGVTRVYFGGSGDRPVGE